MADIFLEIRKFINLMHRAIFVDKARNYPGGKSTHTQRMLVCFLWENADKVIFQRDIEKQFSIRRSTATNLLNALEKSGMIERKSVLYDARLKQILLTEKAHLLHREIDENIKSFEKQIITGIPPDELANFSSTLQKLAENLAKINKEKEEGNTK